MNTEQAFARLKDVFNQGKLAGSWLVQGPYGVGKSALIRRFANFLLTGNENSELTLHPDLKWIEKDYTEEEKKDIIKTIQAGKELDEDIKRDRKSEITIDDIRKGIQFLSLTASGDKWRILVIDTADDMNENAANALLKLLEEPPAQAVIFLLSHNPGKLLPTIRSRCRSIHLTPLSKEEMKSFILGSYPDSENVDALVELSDGSIGKYYKLKKMNGLEYYQEMALLLEKNPIDVTALFSFAEKVSKDESIYDMVKDLLLSFVLLQIKKEPPSKEKLDLYLEIWDDMVQQFKDVKSLYLDKKSTLVSLMLKIGRIK